jgi:hypothetical protein
MQKHVLLLQATLSHNIHTHRAKAKAYLQQQKPEVEKMMCCVAMVKMTTKNKNGNHKSRFRKGFLSIQGFLDLLELHISIQTDFCKNL